MRGGLWGCCWPSEQNGSQCVGLAERMVWNGPPCWESSILREVWSLQKIQKQVPTLKGLFVASLARRGTAKGWPSASQTCLCTGCPGHAVGMWILTHWPGLGWGPRLCISNELPGHRAAGRSALVFSPCTPTPMQACCQPLSSDRSPESLQDSGGWRGDRSTHPVPLSKVAPWQGRVSPGGQLLHFGQIRMFKNKKTMMKKQKKQPMIIS